MLIESAGGGKERRTSSGANHAIFQESTGRPNNHLYSSACSFCFFFQAEDGIRDLTVTGVQTCALPISIVVAERRRRLDFRDAKTMALVQSLALGCKGVDHMEFTADGRFAIATCEFSGQLVKLDLASRAVIGYLTLDPGGLDSASMPQDIRSSPDGRVFYVADMKANGGFLVVPEGFRRLRFIATGKGTHGIYPSRDGRFMYITNRGWNTTAGGRHGPGSISVLDPRTRRVVATL